MCVIRACWTFQKSKMTGHIPVQWKTVWAVILQIPALVSPFISCVPAFCAQNVFASFKFDTIFLSHSWGNYSMTLSKFCESTRLAFFFVRTKFYHQWRDRQIKTWCQVVNCYYYSFKIFPRFWLAKSTLIIDHNQLLMTKFGKILCLARKWCQKCSVFES